MELQANALVFNDCGESIPKLDRIAAWTRVKCLGSDVEFLYLSPDFGFLLRRFTIDRLPPHPFLSPR